ncbi:MAG: hypothetical protein R6U68_13540, partial [Desulfobacteraceae bacterium]
FDIASRPELVMRMFGIKIATLSMINLTAIAVIIMLSLVHYHSLLTGTRVQNGLTIFKTLLILVFICTGFTMGSGSVENFAMPESAREKV